jgi:methyl-accepting chemotaxis protein
MISSIQEETIEAVEAMKAGRAEVQSGIELANAARSAFEGIVSSTTRVNDRVGEIAAATEEQSATSEQISRSIESISTVAQDQAQATGEIARVINELSGSTESLRSLVERFTIERPSSSGQSDDEVTASVSDNVSPVSQDSATVEANAASLNEDTALAPPPSYG